MSRFSRLFRGHVALLALGLALTASACDSNEPEDQNEAELVTQVVLRFQNQANVADVVTITATDSDGDGAGLVFTPAAAALRPGVTYVGTIELNDTVNAVSITDEIKEEAEAHLFRYTVDPADAAAVTLLDPESRYGPQTGADLPFGLEFRVVVAPAAAGTADFNATLFHFDGGGKTSATATSDERDVDIDFPVTFAAP